MSSLGKMQLVELNLDLNHSILSQVPRKRLKFRQVQYLLKKVIFTFAEVELLDVCNKIISLFGCIIASTIIIDSLNTVSILPVLTLNVFK